MLKRVLLIIFFIFCFIQAGIAQEIFKVTSVNFDASNALIFLTSPDNTTEAIMKNVKVVRLQNPKRIYFDINSAVLTAPAQNWYLNSKGIKQVKVNQYSKNPSKIRIMLYLEDDFDSSRITFMKVNNNLVIKLKNLPSEVCKTTYFQNIYSDEKTSSKDFYENLSISSEDLDGLKSVSSVAPKADTMNQIQQAFDASNKMKTVSQTTAVEHKADIIKKEFKLKSKYYLNSVTPRANGFLLSGFGSVSIERPMYLTNPARVAFDIPNAILNPGIRNKEYKIGQDTLKLSQFDSNRVRLVVTSTELEKYFPIFSADGQSALFVNDEQFDITSLFTKTDDAVSYYVKKMNPTTSEFIIAFNGPVVHSIKRDASKLTINLYNTLRYNDQNFREIINPTGFNEMKIDLLPKVGLKLSMPLEKTMTVSSYLGADGKSLRVIVKGLKVVKPQEPVICSEKTIVLPKCSGKKSVVLDAGHGGSDYGAIRSGVNEKDINLDVIKRIQSILISKGVSVTMTRSTDEFIPLPERTNICAKASPDIFVSVHVNSSSKQGISGIETHYYHDDSQNLAQVVHSSLVSAIRSTDRGLFKSKFYVINHTSVPAILVEIGFISNDAERASLVSEERKQQTARAIAEGILKYLNAK